MKKMDRLPVENNASIFIRIQRKVQREGKGDRVYWMFPGIDSGRLPHNDQNRS